jgi:hypothetical protein
MVVMMKSRRSGGVLMVVEAEHEAAGSDPTSGTGWRVQLASPGGRHRIQVHGGRGCRRRCRRCGRQRQRWPRGRRGPHVSAIAAREVFGPRLVGFCFYSACKFVLQMFSAQEDYCTQVLTADMELCLLNRRPFCVQTWDWAFLNCFVHFASRIETRLSLQQNHSLVITGGTRVCHWSKHSATVSTRKWSLVSVSRGPSC